MPIRANREARTDRGRRDKGEIQSRITTGESHQDSKRDFCCLARHTSSVGILHFDWVVFDARHDNIIMNGIHARSLLARCNIHSENMNCHMNYMDFPIAH